MLYPTGRSTQYNIELTHGSRKNVLGVCVMGVLGIPSINLRLNDSLEGLTELRIAVRHIVMVCYSKQI